MSRALHETIDVPNPAFHTGDHHYYPGPPHSAQNQPSQGFSNFVDGSGHIFSMYLELATEEDKKMTENWKADADGILIFTGLFSAAVASLISVSIQDLRQNPQDTSNFYLANIYQATINPNTPNVSCSLRASPPPFSPPNYAVWVNALWFLSLVISITCALLATLQQQWARRYLRFTQSRYSPHKRARIRAFFAEGIEKCLLPWVVETLPTLLHISLFLFFAGLVVFLWNVNLTIFKLVLSWVAICTALYGCVTVMPIIRYDSPYYTPLSSLLWNSVIGVACFVSAVFVLLLYCTVFCRRGAEWLFDFTDRCYDLLLQGMQKRAEETALNSPSEIDTRAFMWTFDCLDEDHELESFFSGLPGLRNSKVVKDPLPSLSGPQTWKLCQAFTGLMDRTFSSDLLPAPVKERRALICAKAIDPVYIPNTFYVLDIILARCHYSGPMVPGIVQIMRGWGNNTYAMMVAQATVSNIVARAHQRDEPWVVLASDELSIPEASVRDCAAHHGDSLSLAILIHVVRQQFTHFQNPFWPRHEFSFVLSAASKFNVQDTSPELQREFCALWNQIVRDVQYRNDLMANLTLGRIRGVYIALHQDTDCAPTRFSYFTEDEDDMLRRPSSYPLCNIPGHHPDSTTHVQDLSASETLVHDVLHDHDNTALFPSSPVGSDLALSSIHDPFPVDESIATASPLDGNLSLPVQTTPESRRVPSTSSNIPGSTRTLAIHESIDVSPKMVRQHLLTPEPSASTPQSTSKPSTSPPRTDAVEHTAANRTTSGDLNVPSLASPAPVLIDTPPTGPLSAWDSAVTESDQQFSSPGSHLSMLAPITDDPCRSWLSSAPDLSVFSDGEGSSEGALRMEKDILYLSSTSEDTTLHPSDLHHHQLLTQLPQVL